GQQSHPAPRGKAVRAESADHRCQGSNGNGNRGGDRQPFRVCEIKSLPRSTRLAPGECRRRDAAGRSAARIDPRDRVRSLSTRCPSGAVLMPRQLSYAKAINEAQRQAMELCDDVVVLGQLADTPAGIFGTTSGLVDTFGPERVQDFPVAENL